MKLPEELIQSLDGTSGFNRDSFQRVHAEGGQLTSIRLNPPKPLPVGYFDSLLSPVPWSANGYYLAERPSFTFDPLFHAGCYYVQEASSMFLEQALQQTTDLSKPLVVLDLSAAPGGKSTHLQSLLSRQSLLVSNEVIRSRAQVLKDNMIKWGSGNVAVTNNDPRDFSRLEECFDVIVVDAPCSGSGLFRRDPEAIAEWSTGNVTLCSQRQQRILADAWPCLKPGGLLVYSTCSYSKEEDEEISVWLSREKGAVYLPLQLKDEWGIVPTENGYRFWPDQVKGEGFFIACFRKEGESEPVSFKPKKKIEGLDKNEKLLASAWLNSDGLELVKHEQTVYAWPQELVNGYNWLLNNLRIIYSGTIVGELMRNKLVPDHALAMSGLAADELNRLPLDRDQAIAYLQRKDLSVEPAQKGWQLVTYESHALGWVNVLPGRINNYYPRELRILKDK